jgi:hypothetical protein
MRANRGAVRRRLPILKEFTYTAGFVAGLRAAGAWGDGIGEGERIAEALERIRRPAADRARADHGDLEGTAPSDPGAHLRISRRRGAPGNASSAPTRTGATSMNL